jgi:23S rRNA pseudouridine1911/1915/1917 synthase
VVCFTPGVVWPPGFFFAVRTLPDPWIVEQEGAGRRLDAWLAARPEFGSRGRAQDALACGKVFLNGAEATFGDAGRRVTAGDRVGYWPDRPGSSKPRRREIVSARAALDVVFQDASVLLVNKPPGWIVEPLPGEEQGEVTLLDLVADSVAQASSLRRSRPYVVHRIDRDTSGLVLFALTAASRDHLKAQFERQTPDRIYLAVVNGHPEPASGTWRDKLVWDKERLIQKRAHVEEARAKDAEARYRVIERFEWQSLIEVALRTGKRNQIRVQAGARGYPLVGERQYRFGQPRDEVREPAFPRQALHAARLAFVHPASGRRVAFTAPLPENMEGLLRALRAGRGSEPAGGVRPAAGGVATRDPAGPRTRSERP